MRARTRWLAGAFIASQELSGIYKEGQTTGRGFIGLAALIFGNWRPMGIFGGAMLFGYPFALKLQDLEGKASHSLLLVTAIAMFAVMVWAILRKNRGDSLLAAVFGGLASSPRHLVAIARLSDPLHSRHARPADAV